MANFRIMTYRICKWRKKKLDLALPEDIKILIQFLRDWGCRQFKKNSNEMCSISLTKWFNIYHSRLPDANTKLLNLPTDQLSSFEDMFNSLMNSAASIKVRNGIEIPTTIGAVGAAKTLFALRKNAFPPWDNAIIKRLGLTNDGSGYHKYLAIVMENLSSIKNHCDNNDISFESLPILLKRPNSSLVKLIDEYFYILYTRKCNPKEIIVLANR